MTLFYSIFIHFYGLLMHFASFFNKKAGIWIKVRSNWLSDLKQKIEKTASYCWFHCSSAGEFEQAIPIINQLRIKDKELKIAVSFFSSSGFDLYKNSGLADLFFYFPLDTRQNAVQLTEVLKPRYTIFIRNEIWLNILSVLNEKSIPVFLVNANLIQKRNYFYQKYLDTTYPLFTKIFDTSLGNTKLERVYDIKNEPFHDVILENFGKKGLVIFLGSSWTEEEKIMADFYNKNKLICPELKIVIAPHEFEMNKQQELENLFGEKMTSYSKHQPENNSSILFLDKKGILKYAYRYADIAFIGGGFNKTVHNVSEAAIYGIPVLFGPNYEKFEEIKELATLETVFPIRNYSEFELILSQLISDNKLRSALKVKLDNYFAMKKNISSNILSEILK